MRDVHAAIADVFERHAKSYEDSNLTSKDVPNVLALVGSNIVAGKKMVYVPAACTCSQVKMNGTIV